MKTRFNSYDIVCCITELQKCIGMRVNNIYDIDNKTYLIRLQRSEEKNVILIESGNRLHSTNFEWPKNVAPSGFSMKMRKHLKNKRLENINQLGSDRIVDMQFGTSEAAYHLILELYDRGNLILTDYDLVILYVLRPHTEGDKFKFAVKEKYPIDRVKTSSTLNIDQIRDILNNAKDGDQLKKILVPHLEYGPSLLEHVLLKFGFKNSAKLGKDFKTDRDINKLYEAILDAENLMNEAKKIPSKGFIIQKKEERPNSENIEQMEYFYSNQEFHPFLYDQHKNSPFKEFETFNQAIDEYYSTLEGQKIEIRALQQEREALKKLQNVRKDHTKRLEDLEKTQEVDKQKAELIMSNQKLVENAIYSIQTALANQIPWQDIANLVKDATLNGDPVAKQIKELKLEKNHITLSLFDPFDDAELPAMNVDIDLDLSAFANARKYYDLKRSAAKKQEKTIQSQSKAFKSAEKKTKQTLKEMHTITNIIKARKVYWFEKFFWFISSENYLVIAGRDQQQNELIVKRYMKPNDIYVHADIHGASSIVIKNPSGQPVPPKTLNEAGVMAICYSVAWEAKVITNAYWVQGDQVSKTAPTGEYLTTGSFMIRGKKNFLPPSHLILGLGFLFRLEDGSVERHLGERKVVVGNDDCLSLADSESIKDEIEIEVSDNENDDDEKKLEVVVEDEEKKEFEENANDDVDREVNEGEEDNKQENVEEKLEDAEIRNEESSDEEQNPSIEIKLFSQFLPETPIKIVDDFPIITDKLMRERKPSESKMSRQSSHDSKESIKQDKKQLQPKRGQKSKLKKIKEKYKDQDDEERSLRMNILQSAGSSKENKKKTKKGKDDNISKNNNKNAPKTVRQPFQKPENIDIDDDETTIQADVDMIDALTGIPVGEDELLFAVPVVAPYNTLNNYKFKVKLTPGTSKRGKAAKTAVNMFLQDRTISAREKDLLKAVKDEQLARNIPGKVKLSAPRLQAMRR
ncbi:ribosome quality control complex subunit NEMF homolog [Onthophagus taurus]|uniref:ribosome quality control complex subunit NEMF homolog n=1 Tax=Onthophagus taurus TaxID=166361 RepID=UPI0039BEAD6B